MLVLFVILFCGMVIKWTFIEFFYAEPSTIQTCVSPNGQYTAYVFESNGGATTGWIYHISVLHSKEKLGKGSGNVFISDIPPTNVVWLDNSTLYVDDYDSIGTTRRKEKIYGIDVRFKSLERKR